MIPVHFPPTPLFAAWLMLCAAGSASARPAVEVQVRRAFPSLTFSQPTDMRQIPGDSSRWFLVERSGSVRFFANDDSVRVAKTALDIQKRVSTAGEGGLLSMAFSPSFPKNGEVFLSYTSPHPDAALISVVSRWKMDSSGMVAGNSESVILTVRQPFTNHNGGCIAFGPDGFLYIGLGDGGSAGDPLRNGQNTAVLLGKILRIDVGGGTKTPYAIPEGNTFSSSKTAAPEIYAWGFRNPWRFSFDQKAPQALWAGDVGQNAWEEIDIVQPGNNYGWNIMEGSRCYPPGSECGDSALALPVAEYGRDQGRSVTGGFVYRGSLLPTFFGTYIFGDYVSGRIWGIDSAVPSAPQLLAETDLAIVSFAQDAEGEVYVLDLAGGGIWRMYPRSR